jgi:hypothetical protein
MNSKNRQNIRIQHGLALALVLALTQQAVAQYSIDWHTVDGGGGTSTGGTYELQGTLGQHDAGPAGGGTFDLDSGYWVALADDVLSCAGAADCADLDGNGARDDNCVWWDCADTVCEDTPLAQFADMGGAFGACPPEGFANIHDKNHALSCFAGTNTCDPINIDAGGAFGSCTQDGFCNIHDANHALSAFAGTTTCSCPSGPMPEMEPEVRDAATLRLQQRMGERDRTRDGTIAVDVFIDGPVDALRSYQLDIHVSGGRSGELKLVDVRIDERKDAVFAERTDAFDAFNVDNGQMLAGLDDVDGTTVKNGAYLATFVYEATKDATGEFVIDLAVDADGQTFLVAPANGVVEVEKTEPAVVLLRS